MEFGNVQKIRNILSKFDINKIFYNNKLMLLFSLITSFIIWLTINSSRSDGAPITISDIPINIQLSESAVQDGLRIFSGQNLKAQINISGNKLIVNRVRKEDIMISSPQASSIISPGNFPLELVAKKVGILKDYDFVSNVQPSNFVTVWVDRYRESEFIIEPEIQFSVNPESFLGATVLSSPNVVLSGPESEISKIKRVVVKGEISQQLNSTFTSKIPIIMYDAYDKQIISETITSSVNEVEVTIPVLMKKTLPIHANFVNIPNGLNLSPELVKISPKLLEIAGPDEQIKSMKSIELDQLDFNKISLQNNKFDLAIKLPLSCKSLNNIYSSEVYIETSKFREKSLWVTKFSFINVPDGKTAKVYTDGIDVKFVGRSGNIRALSSSNVKVEIDLYGKDDASGSMEIPAKIVIGSSDEVWAYGEYLINIEIV